MNIIARGACSLVPGGLAWALWWQAELGRSLVRVDFLSLPGLEQ